MYQGISERGKKGGFLDMFDYVPRHTSKDDNMMYMCMFDYVCHHFWRKN